jgi:phosphoribosylanthranilate isomerase
MPTEVKICGLRTTAVLDAALDAGADYVGLVLFPKSPRNVPIAHASRLASHARARERATQARVVVLTVDAGDALIDEAVAAIRPDILQLHGHETPERCRELKRHTGCEIMKVIGVATREDVAAASAYLDAADRIMFDAKPPPGLTGALPGGNAISFDWRMLEAWGDRWFMLAGGLNPDNVAGAIRLTRAPAVDVSSGVERAPGEKDPDRIRAFIAAARAA